MQELGDTVVGIYISMFGRIRLLGDFHARSLKFSGLSCQQETLQGTCCFHVSSGLFLSGKFIGNSHKL